MAGRGGIVNTPTRPADEFAFCGLFVFSSSCPPFVGGRKAGDSGLMVNGVKLDADVLASCTLRCDASGARACERVEDELARLAERLDERLQDLGVDF